MPLSGGGRAVGTRSDVLIGSGRVLIDTFGSCCPAAAAVGWGSEEVGGLEVQTAGTRRQNEEGGDVDEEGQQRCSNRAGSGTMQGDNDMPMTSLANSQSLFPVQ